MHGASLRLKLRNPPVRGRGRGPRGPGAGPRGADTAGDPPELRSPGAVTVSTSALLREGPHGVVVELTRQLLVGQGVAPDNDEGPALQCLRRVARPGLKPGTPRFSGLGHYRRPPPQRARGGWHLRRSPLRESESERGKRGAISPRPRLLRRPFAAYARAPGEPRYRPLALSVLRVEHGRAVEVIDLGRLEPFEVFGLPMSFAPPRRPN